jgi:hypothetical protein
MFPFYNMLAGLGGYPSLFGGNAHSAGNALAPFANYFPMFGSSYSGMSGQLPPWFGALMGAFGPSVVAGLGNNDGNYLGAMMHGPGQVQTQTPPGPSPNPSFGPGLLAGVHSPAALSLMSRFF